MVLNSAPASATVSPPLSREAMHVTPHIKETETDSHTSFQPAREAEKDQQASNEKEQVFTAKTPASKTSETKEADVSEQKTEALEQRLRKIDQEQASIVQELESRDREVRAHEQAHAAVGGVNAGAPSYSFTTGPNGQRYAVSGEVSIDISKVSGNPQATLAKADKIAAAALAPANPSSQDRKVAAAAAQMAVEARSEIVIEKSEAQKSESAEKEQKVSPAAAELKEKEARTDERNEEEKKERVQQSKKEYVIDQYQEIVEYATLLDSSDAGISERV